MKNLGISLLMNSLSLFIGDKLLDGVNTDSIMTVFMAALIFGLLNYFVKPILELLSLPINLLSFGLFSIVLNGIILLIVSHFIVGFHVEGLISGILLGLIVSISNAIMNKLI